MRAFRLVALLTILAFARPAAAQSLLRGGENTPNFLGSTGLLYVPSANTVGSRGLSVFATGSDRLLSFGGLFGPTDRLELGLTFLDFENPNAGDDFAVNAKFALLKETSVIPGLAVGVVDAFDELSLDQSWYVVASKDFSTLSSVTGLGLKTHLGYGHGLYGRKLFAGAEVDLNKSFGLPIVGSPTFSAIGEWVSSDVNVGVRARYRGFAATLAVFDLGRIGGQLSYTTGLRLW